MLSKIYRALWAKPSPKQTLGDILQTWDSREFFLGVKRQPMVTPEQIKNDLERTIRYSQSSDYAIWAQRVWVDILECMDKLVKDDIDGSQIDFHRGRLSASLDHLRISYQARNMKEQIIKDQEARNKK